MNIAVLLNDQAARIGDRAAIIERGRTISFAELNRAAGSAAGELERAGVAAGCRALVMCPMSIDLYTTLVALFHLGATAVFVDPSAGRRRLEDCIRRARPDAFVAVPRAHLLRMASAAVRSIPLKIAIGGRAPGAAAIGRTIGSAPAVRSCDDNAPAIITFTSGSTGAPKAAVRTHGFLAAQHRALVDSLHLRPGEIDLTTMPIVLLANLASGMTSVIPDADLRSPGAIEPASLAEQIRATGPARTVASPAFLDRLATHALERREPLETLRQVFTGGAPVFPRVLDRLARAAPAASIVAVYGSTEAEPIASIDRRQITDADRQAMRGGAGLLAGVPEPSISLRILPDRWGTASGVWTDAAFDAHALPPGGAGEIVVSGDHVLTGYLEGVGDGETKIRVGDRVWHRTGDAGYRDRDGRLWLLGRCSERIHDRDGIVYPFAVECAASEIPGIVRTAFVRHDERRILVIERNGGRLPSRGALLARFAWARVADVLDVPRIPVDTRHNAKIDYPALRRLLARRRSPG